MPLLRTLLVLALLCVPVSSTLCLRNYQTESEFLCSISTSASSSSSSTSGSSSEFLPDSNIPESEPRVSSLSDAIRLLLYRNRDAPSSSEEEEQQRDKRTSPSSNYKYLSQTLLRSKLYRNSAKSDRRNKVTLSLDVPTNIMNILFDIAKAKNLRAKAAHNARVMAQIGK